jgi:hypothetical protein
MNGKRAAPAAPVLYARCIQTLKTARVTERSKLTWRSTHRPRSTCSAGTPSRLYEIKHKFPSAEVTTIDLHVHNQRENRALQSVKAGNERRTRGRRKLKLSYQEHSHERYRHRIGDDVWGKPHYELQGKHDGETDMIPNQCLWANQWSLQGLTIRIWPKRHRATCRPSAIDIPTRC